MHSVLCVSFSDHFSGPGKVLGWVCDLDRYTKFEYFRISSLKMVHEKQAMSW